MNYNKAKRVAYLVERAERLSRKLGVQPPAAISIAASEASGVIEDHEERERDAERAARLWDSIHHGSRWGLYSAGKIANTPPQAVEDNFDEYHKRNSVVTKMGYADYRAYRAGKQWSGIRSRILARDPLCACCGKRNSVQVHHRRYTEAAMSGHDLCAMIGVCAGCHHAAELYGGVKQSPANASVLLGFGPQPKCHECGRLHDDDAFFQNGGTALHRRCVFCRNTPTPH